MEKCQSLELSFEASNLEFFKHGLPHFFGGGGVGLGGRPFKNLLFMKNSEAIILEGAQVLHRYRPLPRPPQYGPVIAIHPFSRTKSRPHPQQFAHIKSGKHRYKYG